MKLVCEQYPSLLIPKHSVRFVAGVVEVDEEVAALILAESPHVTAADGSRTKSDSKARPAAQRRARK